MARAGATGRRALGITVHTGWAACLLAGGSLRAPQIDARERLVLLPDPVRFLFHRAAEMKPAEAERSVQRARKEALDRACSAIATWAAAHDLVGCAIVASSAPLSATLAEIVASHPRIHTCEGLFYRDVLREAAEANDLAVRVFPPRDLAITASVTAAGRIVGKPWAKDQKVAALAAWAMLGG